jgi:site-specific DNA-methyltransferase (adenine-specific)
MTMLATPPTDTEVENLAAGQDLSDLVLIGTDELYNQARWHREQAESHHQQMLQHYMELGRRLLVIRGRVRHGEFITTVQAEVGISQPTAWRLMQLARNHSRMNDLPADTSVTAALQHINSTRPERERQPIPRVESLPADYHIEHADATDLPIGEGTVRLIVTSPPYGLGIQYANTDDNQGYDVYLEHARAWAAEMYRVAAPNGGRLCLNVPLDITYNGQREAGTPISPKPIYADWVEILKETGWNYRTTIIWNENNITRTTARGSQDSANSPHVITRVEMIAVMYRGEWGLGRTSWGNDIDHDEWLQWTNGLWDFGGEGDPRHPAPFPEELPRRLIRLFSYPGDMVLDPFCGRGTTIWVARQLGRPAYGFDHSDEYVELSRLNLVTRAREAVPA